MFKKAGAILLATLSTLTIALPVSAQAVQYDPIAIVQPRFSVISDGKKLSNISTSDKMVQANSNNTMIWPVPDFYMIDGNFGMRSDGTGPHSGIDIAAEGIDGALVVAVADGTVKYVNEEYSKGLGLGKQIKIQHENNVITVYAHLSEIKVKSGDIVKQGDMIGAVGSTGFSMKPRLRFEVRQIENNIALNPMKFLDLSQMP